MKLRALKRTVCFILAFLMLSGSVEPLSVKPAALAAALEDAQEETALIPMSETLAQSTEEEATQLPTQSTEEEATLLPAQSTEEEALLPSDQNTEEVAPILVQNDEGEAAPAAAQLAEDGTAEAEPVRDRLIHFQPKLSLRICNTVELRADVIPHFVDTDRSFGMWITFYRPDGMEAETALEEYPIYIHTTYDQQENRDVTVFSGLIPLGIPYKATPDENPDYRRAEKQDDWNWEGITDDGLVIKTVYYPVNMPLPFTVNWIDNNSVARPVADIESIFQLQVRKSGTEEAWAPFPTDADSLEAYGITVAPKLDYQGNQYAFTGLPGADSENHPLEYQVVCTPPTGYTADQESFTSGDIVTLRHVHDFSATIQWNDDANAKGLRPDSSALTNLKLYSRSSDGTLTEVTGDRSTWQWTKSDNTWSLKVPNLPTYTDDNTEIEYFLVHGTDAITEGVETVTPENYQTTATGKIYVPYYNNGTVGYAGDEQRCYAGGTITMLLTSTTDFNAEVKWKDDGTPATVEARPAATVTLWRYADSEKTPDKAFQDELASMVVYLDAQGKEHPLSFILPEGSRDATLTAQAGQITLTYTDKNEVEQSETINNIVLPGHDGAGREYTYFLRETLNGPNKNNYSVTYHDTAASYAEGAPNDGMTRKEPTRWYTAKSATEPSFKMSWIPQN